MADARRDGPSAAARIRRSPFRSEPGFRGCGLPAAPTACVGLAAIPLHGPRSRIGAARGDPLRPDGLRPSAKSGDSAPRNRCRRTGPAGSDRRVSPAPGGWTASGRCPKGSAPPDRPNGSVPAGSRPSLRCRPGPACRGRRGVPTGVGSEPVGVKRLRRRSVLVGPTGWRCKRRSTSDRVAADASGRHLRLAEDVGSTDVLEFIVLPSTRPPARRPAGRTPRRSRSASPGTPPASPPAPAVRRTLRPSPRPPERSPEGPTAPG